MIGDPGPSATWENLEAPKYRFNYFDFGLSIPVVSIILDGIILLFPLPPLRKLQISTRKKVGVIAILWLGAL